MEKPMTPTSTTINPVYAALCRELADLSVAWRMYRPTIWAVLAVSEREGRISSTGTTAYTYQPGCLTLLNSTQSWARAQNIMTRTKGSPQRRKKLKERI